jgi:pantoate--beta-alanine ligase
VVIRRMVRDLDIPVRIEICPTVRASDGLALSSRNARLSPDERERAASLQRALQAARNLVLEGERDPAAVISAARSELASAHVEPDYFELVSVDTLVPVERIDGDVLAVVAARVGATRLIDNTLMRVSPGTTAGHATNGRP